MYTARLPLLEEVTVRTTQPAALPACFPQRRKDGVGGGDTHSRPGSHSIPSFPNCWGWRGSGSGTQFSAPPQGISTLSPNIRSGALLQAKHSR